MATSNSVCPFFKTLPNSSIVFSSLHVAWVGLVSPSQFWTLVIPWWFMMLSNIWQLTLSWHSWRSWKHQEWHPSFCWTGHHIILTYILPSISETLLVHSFFKENRSDLPCAVVICWTAFFFLQAVSFPAMQPEFSQLFWMTLTFLSGSSIALVDE